MACFPYSGSSGRRFHLCYSSTNTYISLAFLIITGDLECTRNARVYQTQYDPPQLQTFP